MERSNVLKQGYAQHQLSAWIDQTDLYHLYVATATSKSKRRPGESKKQARARRLAANVRLRSLQAQHTGAVLHARPSVWMRTHLESGVFRTLIAMRSGTDICVPAGHECPVCVGRIDALERKEVRKPRDKPLDKPRKAGVVDAKGRHCQLSSARTVATRSSDTTRCGTRSPTWGRTSAHAFARR